MGSPISPANSLKWEEQHIPQFSAALPGEMWGITTYFNPNNAGIQRQNLALFSRRIRHQGLKLLIVELAFDDAPFQVGEDLGDIVLRRRSNTLLWQKERLLNLGIDHLPASCDKAVWLDGDILFENASWVADTRRLLESYVVVQPFDTACWLPPGLYALAEDLPRGLAEGHCMPGMAFAMAYRHDRQRALADYFEHGHTGFAWAARRSLLDSHHLYDRHILGGGDMVIGHALFGDKDFFRGRNLYCRHLTKRQRAAVSNWGQALCEDVRDSIYYAPGRVLHLWHGSLDARNYLERLRILKENDYDPVSDVMLDETGCWRWSSNKPELHRQVQTYFAARAAEIIPDN